MISLNNALMLTFFHHTASLHAFTTLRNPWHLHISDTAYSVTFFKNLVHNKLGKKYDYSTTCIGLRCSFISLSGLIPTNCYFCLMIWFLSFFFCFCFIVIWPFTSPAVLLHLPLNKGKWHQLNFFNYIYEPCLQYITKQVFLSLRLCISSWHFYLVAQFGPS